MRYHPVQPVIALALGLVLPCLTTSSRLQAGYVPISTSQTPNNESAPGLCVEFGFSSEKSCSQATPDSDPGQQHKVAPSIPPLDLDPANLPLSQGGGAGGTSSPGSGSGGPAQQISLSMAAYLPDLKLVGLLAFEQDRDQPPPFPSRLFRPPRVV